MSEFKELTRDDLLLDEPACPADMQRINNLYRRLTALRLLGFKCRVKYAGLYRLLRTSPIGPPLVEIALQVLEWPNEKERDRFSPLYQLEQIRRGVLARCFPDAPQDSVLEGPAWLNEAEIEGGRLPALRHRRNAGSGGWAREHFGRTPNPAGDTGPHQPGFEAEQQRPDFDQGWRC